MQVLLGDHVLSASCHIAGLASVDAFTEETAEQHSITTLLDAIVKFLCAAILFFIG